MAEVDAGAVAPAVPVTDAPAANAVPAPEVPESDQANQEPVQPRTLTEDEHKRAVAKAVSDRLAKERRRLEREARTAAEAQFYREQVERSQGKQQAEPQTGEPKVTDFPDYEEYLLAKAEWRLEQKAAKKQTEQQHRTAYESEVQEARQLAGRLQEKLESAAEEFGEDFIDQARAAPHITEAMVRFVDESEVGAKVMHFLVQNPKEAQRIAKLGPAGQFRELVKAESQLTASSPTRTPPPITPSNARAPASKDPKDMSDAEWVKWREGELKRR